MIFAHEFIKNIFNFARAFNMDLEVINNIKKWQYP